MKSRDIHQMQPAVAGRKELAARWACFRENYQALGYRKASYEYFTTWAQAQYGDLPSSDPQIIQKIVRSQQRHARSKRSQESS